MRSLLIAGLAVLCVACLDLPVHDDLVAAALDYKVDRPRLLAMRVAPPILGERPVELDALIVGPDGARATEASWRACGLQEGIFSAVFNLECFNDAARVTELGAGPLPHSSTPPVLRGVDCVEEDTGAPQDTGGVEALLPCHVEVALMVEAELSGEAVKGALWGDWYTAPWPDALPELEGIHAVPKQLRVIGEPAPGATLELELMVNTDLRAGAFRWYVDDGVLLDTGRTAPQRFREPHILAPEGMTYTSNRWVLPEDASGELRVWVISEGGDTRVDSVLASVFDLGWTEASVQVSP